jgi:hypothetical protein
MSAIENGSEMSSGTSSENPELPKIPNFEADWRATTPIIEFWPIEQQSCSELTGFQVRSERCCGDFWPLIAPLELLPC